MAARDTGVIVLVTKGTIIIIKTKHRELYASIYSVPPYLLPCSHPNPTYLQTPATHKVVLGATAYHAVPLHVKTNHAGLARGTKDDRRGGTRIGQGGGASRIVLRTTIGGGLGRRGGSKGDGRDEGADHCCVSADWVVELCGIMCLLSFQGSSSTWEGALPCGTRDPRVPVWFCGLQLGRACGR